MTAVDLHLKLDAYLAVRDALGFKSVAEKTLLRDFVNSLAAKGVPDPILAVDALEWATSSSSSRGSSGQASRLSMARGFLTHLRASLPSIEVPDSHLLPRPRRPAPYLFSEAELVCIIEEAGKGPKQSLRPLTRATLVSLLASTGLRVGEAVRLQAADVILTATPAHIVVRETKFRKTRLVPLHPTVSDSLGLYAERRCQLGYDGLSESFFVSESGGPLCMTSLWLWFKRLTARLGIRARDGGRRPCLQCLRHYFAITRLLDWYRQGLDVNSMLPHLSVYLGHTRPADTYWYLTATPELLGAASDKFQAYAGGER